MRRYRCKICGRLFEAKPLGRKPLACPDDRAEAKRIRDRNRYHAEPKHYPPCCQESAKRVCPQHTQWKRYSRDAWNARLDADALAKLEEAFGIDAGDPFRAGYRIFKA